MHRICNTSFQGTRILQADMIHGITQDDKKTTTTRKPYIQNVVQKHQIELFRVQ